jgi:hypothetical protein
VKAPIASLVSQFEALHDNGPSPDNHASRAHNRTEAAPEISVIIPILNEGSTRIDIVICNNNSEPVASAAEFSKFDVYLYPAAGANTR